jgi:TatA/E family protein of Tat protein translocase
MPTVLLVFEFLGTGELMIIAVVALIIFGPRKLPEIGRSLGRAMSEFKRASEDFKRTWEYEVELEQRGAAPTQPAGGGVEGMSGHVAAGEIGAGGAATVARGSAWDAAQVDEAEDAAVTHYDDAQPDALKALGEDPATRSQQSRGDAGPGEPRDS